MKKPAGLCRPLHPLCQREVPGNVLKDLLREVDQIRNLQQGCVISNALHFV